MKSGEVDDFEKNYGYKPMPMRAAVDALAVFVHKDNPIKCLSLAQVDAIFSKTRKRGLEQPGSSAVVQSVATDKYAIGYSGVGYKTADVRSVPIAADNGGECFDASAENAYEGQYAIARFLYIYMNKKPGNPLDPLRGEFVKYVLSKQGQEAVVKDGYYPIPSAVANQDLATFDLK